MGLGAPDLKQGNGVLDGGIFKVARLRNTEVPISVDVQWEDYNPNQNTTMNVRELLAFGNGEVFGSVSSADAALSPKNWIHTWENRSPWYAGSPTDPKSGDNVLEVIAVEEVTNAEAFYESIGQGQYP